MRCLSRHRNKCGQGGCIIRAERAHKTGGCIIHSSQPLWRTRRECTQTGPCRPAKQCGNVSEGQRGEAKQCSTYIIRPPRDCPSSVNVGHQCRVTLTAREGEERARDARNRRHWDNFCGSVNRFVLSESGLPSHIHLGRGAPSERESVSKCWTGKGTTFQFFCTAPLSRRLLAKLHTLTLKLCFAKLS